MQIVRIHTGIKEQPAAEIVGSKAANLARMAMLGLPVPPAFVIPIELCGAIVDGDPGAKQQLADSLASGIGFLEEATGRDFGDRRRPLLVSVRSGAARSMPGMLETVLDVGCTPAAVQGLIRMSGNPRFAFDCRRRFLESYGGVVLGIEAAVFGKQRHLIMTAEGAESEPALDGEALERLVASYRGAIEDENRLLPETPMEQLRGAADAVYRSWMSDRAVTYRRLQRFDDLQGTAVTVQAMVFGNGSAQSGAGVAFSRDPSTGDNNPIIDVLFGAQGEDVVSGRRTPETEDAIVRWLPDIAAALREALVRLEAEFGDVQDVEFTIEQGKLWLLQTRAAKRTAQAAVRFAIDFVHESRITPQQALQRLGDVDLNKLTSNRLTAVGEPVAYGTGASAGIAIGRAAFDPERATRLAASGDPIILVRHDTSTADVAGFAVAAGIVTAVGGRTAHAALVARQLDKPCIVGCAELAVHVDRHCAQFAQSAVREGDWISIDGSRGTIHLGRGQVMVDRPQAELAEIDRWRTAVAGKVAAEASFLPSGSISPTEHFSKSCSGT
jgi:pyruvate, orthophosphate dikinase